MIVLCVLVTAPQAQETAQTTTPEAPAFDYPDTRQGEIAAAFVASFNSGDEETVSAFIAEYGNETWQEGEAKELYSYNRLHQLLGELMPLSVIDSKDADIVVLVKSASIGSYFNVGITLDEASPAMLDEVFIRPAARPKG